MRTFLLVTSILAATATDLLGQRYTIRHLPGAPGLQHGFANAINNQRTVVGELLDGGGVAQAVVWFNGVARALPTDPASNSGWGRGLNERGFFVGKAGVPSAAESAARWELSAGALSVVDLGIAPGDNAAVANAINDHAIACGYSDALTGSNIRPCLWIGDAGVGNPTLLPLVGAFFAGEALGIHDGDIAVGYLHDGFSNVPAAWNPGPAGYTLQQLPTLGVTDGVAVGINANGVIAGNAFNPSTGLVHLVTWTGGVVTDRGSLGGTTGCYAHAINLAGDIVGRTVGGPSRAVLRRANGAVTDLNTLLPVQSPWTLIAAHDVNDRGDIVGYGALNGLLEPFLMSPVRVSMTPPTPGTANTNNTLTASGATPGQTVFFLVAFAGGETTVNGCLESLDLGSPGLLGTAAANAAGVATFTFFAPSSLIGLPLLWQSYDLTGCASSNSVAFTF